MKDYLIITGTNRGLGKAFFDYFMDAPATIVAISRSFPDYQQEHSVSNGSILVKCDLAELKDPSSIPLLNGLASQKIERLTFINNAATIHPVGPIGNLDPIDIAQSVHTNIVAPLLLINYLVTLNSNKLKVINITSGAAQREIEGWAMYCSTKAAMEMFCRVLEKQYQKLGRVEVLQPDPGLVDTGMQEFIRASDKSDFPSVKTFKEAYEHGKLQSPKVVVEKIVKLAQID